ncbi:MULTISPECIES: glycosyltransferase [Thalassospira]|uniref:Glycosyl transferase family 1 domain-containing protein n=1 Tax=Thalassospira aquimaris TaxID=3037796 RepID=A0ABT6G5Y0_9PROT|nr:MULTISPECIES: glycosyltransferase [Thalassospira]MDG4717408.1 hypothetical protein [Thalassospira sp. FZY0004]
MTLEAGLVSNFRDPEMGKYAQDINGEVFKVNPSLLARILCRSPRLPLRPDRWLLANSSVRKKALDLLPNGYDCVVTRSQYHSAHLIGLHLKKRFPELPWIACFSDPWSNSDHQKNVPLFSAYSRNLEKKVLANANQLVFPTEGLMLHMTNNDKNLRQKSSIVPHGYDPRLYHDSDELTKKIPANGTTEYCWRIFGSFYGNRQPDILIKALQLINIPKGKKVRIEIYGTAHEKYTELDQFNTKYNDREILYMGQTPHKNALRLMQNSDLLIVVDSTELEQSFYLPSKIIDYFGSGTPVLSICRAGTVENITIANGHHVANIDDTQSISIAMEKAIEREKSQRTRKKAITEYDAHAIGSKFRKIIQSNHQ